MRAVLTVAGLLCAGLAAAEPAMPTSPLIDTRPVPQITDQSGYVRYLAVNLPRAFAIGPGGSFGYFGGMGTIEQAREKALASCSEKARTACALYGENLETVWPAARRTPPAPPAAPLIAGPGYAFVADARYVWHGPAAARGVYVWSHGYGGAASDGRALQPQPHVRAFNNAGYDVVKFNRDPNWDGQRDEMAEHLRLGIAELRRRGWKHVVAGGQSRGAWNSLQLLGQPGGADVVIAVSPAAHGTSSGDLITRQQTDLWRLLHDAAAPATRVAFVQFEADPYSADPDRRVGLFNEQLRPRVGPLLIIDRPPGLTGHYGGQANAFATGYADCLLHFATDAQPKSACPAP